MNFLFPIFLFRLSLYFLRPPLLHFLLPFAIVTSLVVPFFTIRRRKAVFLVFLYFVIDETGWLLTFSISHFPFATLYAGRGDMPWGMRIISPLCHSNKANHITEVQMNRRHLQLFTPTQPPTIESIIFLPARQPFAMKWIKCKQLVRTKSDVLRVAVLADGWVVVIPAV